MNVYVVKVFEGLKSTNHKVFTKESDAMKCAKNLYSFEVTDETVKSLIDCLPVEE